jgi:DNA recombination protein RmuC
MDLVDLLPLLAGLALGVALGVLAARARHAEVVATLRAEARAANERSTSTDDAHARLADQFRALSADALARSGEQLLQLAEARFGQAQARGAAELDQRRQAVEHLVAPLKDTLARVEGQLRQLEQARVAAYTSLTEQVSFVRDTSEKLRTQTMALVSALRAPQARGRWGEMQLRRVVEIAGMVERCDFDEQMSAETTDGRQRPDMIVRLAGGKNVVVDAKVSLAAYLEAAETSDDTTQRQRLAAHARHLRAHVDALAAKSYWAAFQPAPEFVVLFVPGEAFLAPALEHDPTLLEHAMGRRVVIATPTTLITMLRTVAYSWQQAALADSAREVFELGRELYQRLSKLGEHVDKLGRTIGRVVSDYNTAVGSLEGRVLVTARRLNDLEVVDADLPAPRTVDEVPRPLGAHELVTAAADARPLRALRADFP